VADGVHIAQSFIGEAMVYTCLHILEKKQEMAYTCLYFLAGMMYAFLTIYQRWCTYDSIFLRGWLNLQKTEDGVHMPLSSGGDGVHISRRSSNKTGDGVHMFLSCIE